MTVQLEVIVDTREKHPWELASNRVLGVETTKLETGDYTVKGMENLLVIDRKASVSELATNVMQKRFKDELMRIKDIPHAFIIIEASASDVFTYPETARLPRAVKEKIRMNGRFLMACLAKMQIEYEFNIIFADNRTNAQLIAINLMEQIYLKYNSE